MYLAKVIHGDGFSRLVAVKLLHPKWTENEEIASRMRDEARLLGWLRHKNIVDVMDLTMIDGRCAVLMEYLEAVDLKVIVTACLEHGARIPLRVCLEVCSAVASALDAAYNRPPYAGEKPLRVIHRDIKPSNIMVDEGGTSKVLDFGVARADFEQREAKTQELSFGSIEYMPPERLFFEPESPASDVYSLGATLYEMLALEKLGKAKLRPPEQERFVEDRFDDLLERHPMPSQEVEDILHDLLFDMLAFNEADRPSAADCVSRMRSFARKLTQQETIEEWCEQVIPPLHRQSEKRGATKSKADGLVDRVVTEDTANFVMRGGARVPAPPPTPEPPQDRGGDPPRAQGDDRFDAMKQAALAELGDGADAPPAPQRGEPVGPPVQKMTQERPVAAPVASLGSAPSVRAQGSTATAPLPELDPATERHARPAAPSPPEPAREQQVPTVVLPGKAAMADAAEEPSVDSGSGTGLILVGLLVGALGFVVFFSGALVVGAGGLWYASSPDLVDAPVAAVPAAPAPPVAGAAQPALPAQGALFVSKLPSTKRISVRCGTGQGDGASAAAVKGASLGDCTVTAVGSDRKRATAVVRAVEQREYTCFAGGENACE
ncbi:MAG: serine/threonine protein kinase [Myxococcota bacterium]